MNVMIGDVIPGNDQICFGGAHYKVVRKDLCRNHYTSERPEEEFVLCLMDANGNELVVFVPTNIRVDVVTH